MMNSILYWKALAFLTLRAGHSDARAREQGRPALSLRMLVVVHVRATAHYNGIPARKRGNRKGPGGFARGFKEGSIGNGASGRFQILNFRELKLK